MGCQQEVMSYSLFPTPQCTKHIAHGTVSTRTANAHTGTAMHISQKQNHIYTHVLYIYICARVQSNTPRHMMLKTSLKIRNVSAPKIEHSIHIKENGLHN